MTATPDHSIIAGGDPDDFLTVRHVRIAGTHREIGQRLAAVASDVHGQAAMPRPAADALVESARRRWFARHRPAHAERICGAADHFCFDSDDTAVALDWLGT